MSSPVREEMTLEGAPGSEDGGKAVDLDTIVLDGDSVPEQFRGKKVSELLTMTAGAMQALGESDGKRKQLEQALAERGAAPPPPPPPPLEEPKDLTDEELNELYQKSPVEAIKVMQAQSERRVQKNWETRMGPLAQGSMTSAEQAARARYPEEFELFGEEIKKAAARVPNKEFMAQPQAWDDLISFVRGQRDNFDKLVEYRARKKADAAAEEARRREAASAGPTVGSQTRSQSSGSTTETYGLDEAQMRAADNMGISYKEYAKWVPTAK